MDFANIEEWDSFFVAEVGATAALLGLLVVAITINLEQIVAYPWLPRRALQTILLLLNTLIIGSFGLVPFETAKSYGTAVLVVAVIAWLVILGMQILPKKDPREKEVNGQPLIYQIIAMQIATLPFIVAGLLLLLTGAGMFWIMFGTLVSYVIAIANAWVLMVEIRR